MAEQFPGVKVGYRKKNDNGMYTLLKNGDAGIKEILDINPEEIFVIGDCKRSDNPIRASVKPIKRGDYTKCPFFKNKKNTTEKASCAFCEHWDGPTLENMYRLEVLFSHPEILMQRLEQAKALTAAVINRFNDLDMMDYD